MFMKNKSRLFLIILLFGLISPAAYSQETGDEIPVQGAELGRIGEPVAVDPDKFKFSEAETKLWMDNHLKNIDHPVRIYYEFTKTGSYEDGFNDSVYLDILKINKDGSKNAALQFFSADRQQPAKPDNLTNILGNPVLGIYMQGDVYEMNRLTSGSWRYFQRQIKLAFSKNATIEPVTFDFNGKEVKGEKISITPYLHDPHRQQFIKFADKRYEFILSHDIPGTLYQIKTVIPDNSAPGKEPLIMETLTFKSAKT